VFSRLRTARLYLEPLGIDDLEPVHGVWCEAGVRRYLWDDQLIDRDRAAAPLRASERDFREQGFGLWGLYRPTSHVLLGFCGLRLADLFPGPELLFGLGDVYWGQGLATEAATGVLRYAFEGLGCAVIGAATDAANSRSSRVLGRLGMRLLRRADHQGLDTLFYGISRSEWNRGDFMPGE
jgi:[ribosomal protein S5]-alanine N-acetyltransferase